MEIEKRALYNLLRMNRVNDPTLDAEQWQIEDYRSVPTKTLFSSLQKLGIPIDQQSFVAYSDETSSPEELTDLYLDDTDLDPREQDHVYLLLFELWRRLLPERICLSIFCDELDHQIHFFDQGDTSAAESLQDSIANLQIMMDENADQGIPPTEIFKTICSACANNLETFFYDYIAEQIDIDNIAYASELVEGFGTYFKGNKWFDLLNIRIMELSDSEAAHEELRKIVQRAAKDDDLAFNLELLSLIVQMGEKGEFNKMVRKTVALVHTEEDFLDLLSICADYYGCLDEDQKEIQVQEIIETREKKSLETFIDSSDPDIAKLLKILR